MTKINFLTIIEFGKKIHSNFPKTLDKIEHDIKIEDVSDQKILSVVKNSLKEDRQICKHRNR